MRSLTDTLTRGGFRDDTHRAAVEAAAVDLAPGQLRGNPPYVLGSPEKVADGVSGGPATHTHAGASEAAQRALQEPRTFTIQTSTVSDSIGSYISFIEDEGDVALHGVCAIYDAATRALASAGPLPLASNEPYSEENGEFSLRIGVPVPVAIAAEDVTAYLDGKGKKRGLPRARLVPATTMQGGSDG